MTAAKKKRGQKLIKRWSKKSHEASVRGTEHLKENFIERLSNARSVRLLILQWGLIVVALIFLAIAQASWYQGSYSTSAYVQGGNYIEGTLGKINSLNPLFATTSSEETASRLMFASLAADDYTGHTGGDLAQRITHDDSSKNWTVQLREGLKWSDGTPITNADVIFTVELIQDKRVNTSYSTNLSGVKVSEQDGALVFNLAAAYNNFDAALNFPILPKHVWQNVDPAKLIDADFAANPITSGPFTFKGLQAGSGTGNSGNDKIVYLEANPNYYKGRPLLDTFAVHAYSSTDEIKTALKNGTIQATAELSSSLTDELVSDSITEKQTALNSGVFAFINTTSSQLNSKTVRQALRQGIDMSEVRGVLNGEMVLDYPILQSQLPEAKYPALPAYDYNAAKATLESAGVNKQIPLQIVTVSSGYMPELAKRMAEQIEKLGFSTSVSVYEPDQNFMSSVLRQRNYDILVYEIELGAEPDLFAYYHSTQANGAGLNLSNYRSAIADDALLAVRTSKNEQFRNTKYDSFLKTWVNDVPAIGIYQPNLSYYLSKNLRSFSEDNRLVDVLDRFDDVNNWAAEKAERFRTP